MTEKFTSVTEDTATAMPLLGLSISQRLNMDKNRFDQAIAPMVMI